MIHVIPELSGGETTTIEVVEPPCWFELAPSPFVSSIT